MQLNRLINTIKVVQLPKSSDKSIDRELILCKVNAKDEARAELLRIAEVFGAKILDVISFFLYFMQTPCVFKFHNSIVEVS